MRRKHFLIPIMAASLLVLGGCSQRKDSPSARPADPLAGLAIETAAAQEAAAVPIASVPGIISLPPEARVAVTSPYQGAAVRVFVIEGQQVRRGQPLALVRAAQSVQLRGDLARSQAELGLARARSERLRQLSEEGIIAGARYDEARAQLHQSQATVAENRRLAAQAGVGANGLMTLAAPIAGRVQHVGVETGGSIDGMSAPFVIENTAAYRVDLQLPERLVQKVRPGMAVEIALPVEGGPPISARGTLLSVAPSIDPQTRSLMAKASIAAAPGVVAGRNVMVTIQGAGATPGISVPASALTRIRGVDHVFVRSAKGFVLRKVTLATVTGKKAYLTAGLKPGEVVATSAIPELKSIAVK